jgi:ribosomal-protein-alanine N-acetyltransferase
MEELLIKPMTKSDLQDVCDIERQVFPDPWSMNMFEEEIDLSDMYSLITVNYQNHMVAYGGLLNVRDEGHITNLAVDPLFHGQGIGKTLVFQLIKIGLQKGIRNVSLEVRTTNTVAQELVMSVININSAHYQEKLFEIEQDVPFIITNSDLGLTG